MPANLNLNLTANNAELIRKLKESKEHLKDYGKNTTDVGTQVTSAFMKMGAVVGGVAGALDFAKKAMNSTEGGADKLEFTVAGLEGGFKSLLRNLSTASFGNIISGFDETYKAAKKLAEKFDDLEVFSAFSNWEIAGLKRQSAQLKEAASDMTKTKVERADIWSQIVVIEEKINNKSQALADKKLGLEKQNWVSINKVQVEAAMTAYKTSLDMTDKQTSEMGTIYGVATAYYDHFKKGALETQEGIAKTRMLEAGFTQEQVDSYMTLQKLERGEKDNLVLLYNFQSTAEDAKYNAQMRYNTAIMKDSRLEIGATKELAKEVKDLNDEYLRPELLGRQSKPLDGGIYKPRKVDLTSGFKTPTINWPAIYNEQTKYAELTKNQMGTIQGMSETMVASIEGGWKGMAKAFEDMLKQMAIKVAAYAAVFIALKVLFPESGAAKGLLSFGSGLKSVLGFANGTNFAPGGLSMVGENGPELVNIPRGSQVFSNSQSASMMSGGTVLIKFQNGSLQGYMDYQNRKINSYS